MITGTGVHDRPDSALTINRNGRSRSTRFGVHDRPDRATWPADFRFTQQETGSGAAFLAHRFGLTGPAYMVATACSSGAKTFAAGRRLIRSGLVDAAIVGGADTLCRLTSAEFTSLEAVSGQICRPFSANRDGITIGEGGALFLLTQEPTEISLRAAAETSDAYHISAPDPEGGGTLRAMEAALAEAGLQPAEVGYLNLHGTATPLNDAMEAKAVNAIYGCDIPCGSTKAWPHTRGRRRGRGRGAVARAR